MFILSGCIYLSTRFITYTYFFGGPVQEIYKICGPKCTANIQFFFSPRTMSIIPDGRNQSKTNLIEMFTRKKKEKKIAIFFNKMVYILCTLYYCPIVRIFCMFFLRYRMTTFLRTSTNSFVMCLNNITSHETNKVYLCCVSSMIIVVFKYFFEAIRAYF